MISHRAWPTRVTRQAVSVNDSATVGLPTSKIDRLRKQSLAFKRRKKRKFLTGVLKVKVKNHRARILSKARLSRQASSLQCSDHQTTISPITNQATI